MPSGSFALRIEDSELKMTWWETSREEMKTHLSNLRTCTAIKTHKNLTIYLLNLTDYTWLTRKCLVNKRRPRNSKLLYNNYRILWITSSLNWREQCQQSWELAEIHQINKDEGFVFSSIQQKARPVNNTRKKWLKTSQRRSNSVIDGQRIGSECETLKPERRQRRWMQCWKTHKRNSVYYIACQPSWEEYLHQLCKLCKLT
jgi:hypothetical protein